MRETLRHRNLWLRAQGVFSPRTTPPSKTRARHRKHKAHEETNHLRALCTDSNLGFWDLVVGIFLSSLFPRIQILCLLEAALIVVVVIVARQTRHRERRGAGEEVGVDDEIEVPRPGHG